MVFESIYYATTGIIEECEQIKKQLDKQYQDNENVCSYASEIVPKKYRKLFIRKNCPGLYWLFADIEFKQGNPQIQRLLASE